MKEIDFLPEWYKSGRRRQMRYRTQYIALGGIFAVMMVWNLVCICSLSSAKTQLARMAPKQTKAADMSREFAGISGKVTQLQKKAKLLEEIDSRIDVASVLAEVSFLLDEKIVLNKVDFKAEKFADGLGGTRSRGSGSAVRVANSYFGRKRTSPLGDVRFKVVINGVAADAGDVAELVCRLEDSPYFCRVYPSFSRSKSIKRGQGSAGVDFQVTEFEVGCYLANYDKSAIDG